MILVEAAARHPLPRSRPAEDRLRPRGPHRGAPTAGGERTLPTPCRQPQIRGTGHRGCRPSVQPSACNSECLTAGL